MKGEMNNLKLSVSGLTKEISDIKKNVDIQRVDIDVDHEHVLKLEERMKNVEESIEKLDQYSRRENVIIYCLADSNDESVSDCRKKVIDCFKANTRKTWIDKDL